METVLVLGLLIAVILGIFGVWSSKGKIAAWKRKGADRNSLVIPPKDVPPDTESYVCRLEDGDGSVMFEKWFSNRAPINGFGLLIGIDVTMHHPGEHGMGTGEEWDDLGEIEDFLVAQFVANGAYYVGRVRHKGLWRIYLYGSTQKKNQARKLVLAASARFPDYRMEATTRDDPSWSHYLEFLLPTREQWQWIMDRKVVENLMRNGDCLSMPRKVDHRAYFRAASDRSAFQQEVEKLGYAVLQGVEKLGTTVDQVREREEEQYPFMLDFYRADPVELPVIHQAVMQLRSLTEKHRGKYDGWGTVVVKHTDPTLT